MKKTFSLFLPMLLLISTLCHNSAAQGTTTYDCNELQIMLEEGQSWFEKYTGEETWSDIFMTIYEYNFSLWHSAQSEFIIDDEEYMWVDFYYSPSYDYDEVSAWYKNLKQTIENCQGDHYFLSSNQSEYSILYAEYTHEKDRENEGYYSYPQIIISLEEEEDYYYVCISILGSDD